MRRLLWGFTLLVAAGPVVAAAGDREGEKPAPAEQVKSLIADYDKSQREFYAALNKAKTEDEQAKAQEKRPKPEAVAARLLELAEESPNDAGVTPVALVHIVTLPLHGAEAKLRHLALERLA